MLALLVKVDATLFCLSLVKVDATSCSLGLPLVKVGATLPLVKVDASCFCLGCRWSKLMLLSPQL